MVLSASLFLKTMVYTITLNTSLDYVVHVDRLSVGQIHKSSQYSIYPGGKGINVSQILKEFGIDSTAVGFVAGHTGECFVALVEDIGITTKFIKLSKGITRINVKTRSHEYENVTETDINCAGPDVNSDELARLKAIVEGVDKNDIVVISGSVPTSVTSYEYGEIIRIASEKGATVIVDATGEYLSASLIHKPFLVKPNEQELREFFDADSNADIEMLAFKMKELGAKNVLVSLGATGALLCTNEGEIIRMEAPKGLTVNTVGAGDSMVAGFVAGLVQNKDMGTALKLGVCAGSATAFSEGLASYEDIERLIESV